MGVSELIQLRVLQLDPMIKQGAEEIDRQMSVLHDLLSRQNQRRQEQTALKRWLDEAGLTV